MGSSVILPPPGQPKTGTDPSFKSAAIPNLVSFAFDRLSPPSSVYLQRDDRLHVKILNSAANQSFQLSARLLLPIGPIPGQPDAGGAVDPTKPVNMLGFILPIQQVFTPTSDRTANEFDIPLAEGYLLSVVVSPIAGPGTFRGQSFVTVGLQRGAAVGFRYMQLISDYAAFNLDLGWPGGPLRGATEPPGFRRTIQQANPAAGADLTFTASFNQKLTITSINAQFVTSAAVATRIVELIVDDGANVMFRIGASITQAAGLTVAYTMASLGTATATVATDAQINLPPGLQLAPGWRIRTNTAAIQAGDQWSNIILNAEEWIQS